MIMVILTPLRYVGFESFFSCISGVGSVCYLHDKGMAEMSSV